MICNYARMLVAVMILPVGLCFCACSGDDDDGDDTDTSAADCTVEKIAADSPTGYGEILGLPSGDIYVLGAGLRHFDGSTWNLVSTGDPPMSLYSVWGTSNSDLFVIGCTSQGQTESLIRHYDGQTWTDMDHPDGYERMLSVWGAAPNDVFAIAYSLGGNAVLHYNGQAWTEMHTGINSFTKLWGTSGSDVYALRKEAGSMNPERMYHYNGETWSEITPPSSAGVGLIKGIWGTGPNNLYFVGGTGDEGMGGSFPIIVHYDGSNWTSTVIEWSYDEQWEDPPDERLNAIWGYGDDSIYAVGTKSYYYNGADWREIKDLFVGYNVWGASTEETWVASGFMYKISCQ